MCVPQQQCQLEARPLTCVCGSVPGAVGAPRATAGLGIQQLRKRGPGLRVGAEFEPDGRQSANAPPAQLVRPRSSFLVTPIAGTRPLREHARAYRPTAWHFPAGFLKREQRRKFTLTCQRRVQADAQEMGNLAAKRARQDRLYSTFAWRPVVTEPLVPRLGATPACCSLR